MRKPKKSKDKRVSTFNKNHQRYLRLTLNDEFKLGLWFIRDMFRLPKVDLEKQCPPTENETPPQALKRIKKLHRKAQEERVKLFKDLNPQRRKSFDNFVDLFLKKWGLESEWYFTVADVLISNFFCPPRYNLSLRVIDDRLLIQLNPTTSRADIDEAWPYIERTMKRFYPTKKSFSYKPKFSRHLEIYLKDLKMGKETKILDPESLEHEELKKTDLDRAGELFPDEEDISEKADLKRRSSLRQIRRRMRA